MLVEDPRTNEALDVQGGKVRCHGKDRDEVYRKAVDLRPKRFAVLLTSKIVKFLTKLSSGGGVKLLQGYVLRARQGRSDLSAFGGYVIPSAAR